MEKQIITKLTKNFEDYANEKEGVEFSEILIDKLSIFCWSFIINWDLVFVAPSNKDTQGAYGIYDYEIRVPARLREYYTVDNSGVVFYVEMR